MASEKNLRSIFSDIAKAIRRKKGNTNKITPINFSDEIDSIESGVFPQGKITLIDTSEYDVTQYATAQIVDEKLKPENIAKDITILGVTGTMQSGSDITANIKVTNSISDIMGTEHNKLFVLNNTSGLDYKVVDKIEKKIKPNSEAISTLETTLTKNCGYGCCARYNNFIYILNAKKTHDDYDVIKIMKFNCLDNSITQLELNTYTSESCCASYGKYIYIFGGSSYNSRTNKILKFDCETETYTTLTVTLPKVKIQSCCARYNNFIYIFGGNDDTGLPTNTIYKFDCETETITTLSSTLPKTIQSGSSINYGKFIYIFYFNSVYKLDCETDTVTTILSDLDTNEYHFTESTASIIGNNIYLFKNKYITKFDCETDEISKISVEIPATRNYACASSFENNIYIFGGNYYNTIFNFSVEFEIELQQNNVLIYNANSNYSFDLITDQVTIPIKKVYIGDSNNTARLANAYLYDETQTGWVNVNTGEVLTEVLTE